MIVNALFAQVKHDFLVEYRNWPQSLALLLFMWTIAYVIFRVRPEISMQEFNFVFWIILLLISINVAVRGMSHSGPGERLMLYTLVSPTIALISRIFFNVIYLLIVSLAFYFAMMMLFYPQISPDIKYLTLVVSGASSIGVVLSFISAISRHVTGQNTAMSILSIPLLIPVVILLHGIGGNLLMGNQLQGGKYVIILGITMMSAALSIILFPYIWRE